MGKDVDNNVEYYNKNADSFFTGSVNADMAEDREAFLAYVPAGGKILDAGCGSGRDMIAFRDAGFDVSGFDASEELCRIAAEKTGIPVKQLFFEELEGEQEYDGIWACASLLHVARTDLPDVLRRLENDVVADDQVRHQTDQRLSPSGDPVQISGAAQDQQRREHDENDDDPVSCLFLLLSHNW